MASDRFKWYIYISLLSVGAYSIKARIAQLLSEIWIWSYTECVLLTWSVKTSYLVF